VLLTQYGYINSDIQMTSDCISFFAGFLMFRPCGSKRGMELVSWLERVVDAVETVPEEAGVEAALDADAEAMIYERANILVSRLN